MTLPFRAIGRLKPVHKDSRGEGFESVQEFLVRFGYLSKGEYAKDELDPRTAEAIAKYQELSGLKVSGNFTRKTQRQMRGFRCGYRDVRSKGALVSGCKWLKNNLTFAFDSDTADVAGEDEFQAIRNAFTTWSSVTDLFFDEVLVTDSPDIQLGWRPSNDPDHNLSDIVAHSDDPPGCPGSSGLIPVPVHFNDSDFSWTIGAEEGFFDVETVAVHEIGHALGLDHSSDFNDVMFKDFEKRETKRDLTQTDIDAIKFLYG
jgi:hypothetical protein